MKQVSILGISLLLVTAVAFTDFPQQEKNKNDKKEQQDKKAKSQDKKNNPGNSNANKNKNDQPGNKNQKDNQGKNNERNKDNKGLDKMNGNNSNRSDNARGNTDMRDGYKWDRETFKDRNKYKNQEKVTICHKFNNDNEPAVTLNVSVNALKAHMDHGDAEGSCPDIKNDRFSDDYIRERNDYYERIQESREKVLYSRSILDYAVQRLTDSRVQLVNMQNRNMPAAEIERKQATVLELEQNVSLLETLIGVTSNLIANKLQ